MNVVALAEFPEGAALLARWNHEYWAPRTPTVSRTDWEDLYRSSVAAGSRELPQTLVAVDDDHLVGGVTIIALDDVKDFPQYCPWIAALYVGEEWRGRRVGRTLVDAALERIQHLGYDEAYLWTDTREQWYLHQGWRTLHRVALGQLAAVVMTKPCAPDVSPGPD
jgi:GNAT superfamily N-acetyltransferase